MLYQESITGVTPEMLKGFFEGWPTPPTPQIHLNILAGSTHVVLAIDGDCVVGFVTALSDGVLSAYIPLLEVLPSYRKKGIGSELMRRLLIKLRGLYMIDVLCDPAVQPFYERFAMQRCSAMMLRNYSAQRGITSL